MSQDAATSLPQTGEAWSAYFQAKCENEVAKTEDDYSVMSNYWLAYRMYTAYRRCHQDNVSDIKISVECLERVIAYLMDVDDVALNEDNVLAAIGRMVKQGATVSPDVKTFIKKYLVKMRQLASGLETLATQLDI